MSYIPKALTDNDCAECHKLLWIRVVKSDIVPAVKVSFLPKSQYQFYAEFEFQGLFAIPVFSITVQINPEFKQYFSSEDLAQIQYSNIDPALLVKVDN